MIKDFFRSRARDQFRTRSPARDVSGDQALLGPIAAAIEHAVTSLQEQRDGLALRIDDAVGRASITAGNDVYEHDTRDHVRTQALQGFESELANATARLTVVDRHIANLKFVRAAFLTRFPKP
jgi:hypothetical protein